MSDEPDTTIRNHRFVLSIMICTHYTIQMKKPLALFFLLLFISCMPETKESTTSQKQRQAISLTLEQAEALVDLPFSCIQKQYPYKAGLTISKEEDLQLPIKHHPAFYGCFDWHSAVHGHWSIVYLLSEFPQLSKSAKLKQMLKENLTAENIKQEIKYFELNEYTSSFERTYGWAWLLKLVQELDDWGDPVSDTLQSNLQPLATLIAEKYIDYLPKLVYPIRVGEHSNTAFGLSFAWDYAKQMNDQALQSVINQRARDFYMNDANCPLEWEPSGYDFLSPCLQEMDIMRKVLSDTEFTAWSKAFLPSLYDGTIQLETGKIRDRSDGKLVHLDGLNFSRAWCLYSLDDCDACISLADEHLSYSLEKITDGDYAGQHWLASFALYAFKSQQK